MSDHAASREPAAHPRLFAGAPWRVMAAHPLLTGTVFWLAVAVLATAVRGVAWDEAFERAQVLTGQVPYPAWHPLYQYAHRAFGLHYVTAAALLRLTDSALVVCGLRNVLHLWMTTLPAFLIAASMARRPVWGHAAAVITFIGAHIEFASYYPLFVWPDMFTSGHIGMGYALCTLWAWMTGRIRLGAFLLCAMPLVHIGQMPPVLGAAALWMALRMARREAIPWRTMAPWAAAGLGLVAAYAAVRWAQLPEMPADSPLLGAGSSADAWARYTLHNDVHRAFPRFGEVGDSFIAMGTVLTLAALAWRLGGAVRAAAGWSLAYGALCLAAFAGGLAAMRLLGEATPFVLVAWMPHRMPNHAAVLLVAVACGLLGALPAPQAAAARGALLAALAFEAAKPLLGLILPAAWFARYAAPPEMTLYLLLGAAALLALDAQRPARLPMGAAALLWLLLASYHQTGAAYAALGALLAVTLRMRPQTWLDAGRFAQAAAVLMAACCVHVGWQAWQDRAPLPVPAWRREIAQALDKAGAPGSMLVTPPWLINVQEQTGHPVLVTYETHQFLPYARGLAAGIERLYGEVYGQRFGAQWQGGLEAWRGRTTAEWQALAERYEFDYVLAPRGFPLALEPVLEGHNEVLYAIPR